jgi:hypothetical protein
MLLREHPSSIVRCASGEPSCPGVVFVEQARKRFKRSGFFSYRLVPGAPSGTPGSEVLRSYGYGIAEEF